MNPLLFLGILAVIFNYGINPLAVRIAAEKDAEDFRIAAEEIAKEERKKEEAAKEELEKFEEEVVVEENSQYDWIEV